MRRITIAVMLACGLAAPAHAGTYKVTIDNPMGYSILRMAVKGGEVTKPPPMENQPREFTVTLTLPEGVCFTRVSFWFDYSVRSDVMGDFCATQRITIQ